MAAHGDSQSLEYMFIQLSSDRMRALFSQFFKPSIEERRRLNPLQLSRNAISGNSFNRVCGMVACAIAVQAAHDADLSNLPYSVDLLLRTWFGLSDTTQASPLPVAPNSLPAIVLDNSIAEWRQLNTAQELRNIGEVRAWIRSLCSGVARYQNTEEDIFNDVLQDPYKAEAARETWLLYYRSDNRAAVGRLFVEAIGDGEGCLYSHPERNGQMQMSTEFVDTIQKAWNLAASAACPTTQSTSTADYDYCWWLEGYSGILDSDPALRGASHGAAAAVAFTQLLAREPIDPEFVVTGEIEETGHISGVGFVNEKSVAALGLPAITRLCVPAVNYEQACEGARQAGRTPQNCVFAVNTIAELIPHASGLPEQIRRLCANERDRILLLASQRLQRTLSRWQDFQRIYVPVRVKVSRVSAETGSRHVVEQSWHEVRGAITRALVVADSGLGKTALLWFEVAGNCAAALEHLEQNYDLSRGLECGFYLQPKSLPVLSKPHGASALMTILVREIMIRISIRESLAPHIESFLSRQISEGNCVIHLDALDEAPYETQVNLQVSLQEFVTTHPKARIITSMRPAALGESDRLLGDWDRVELLPFGPEQIRQTVFAWHNAQPDYAASLWQRIEKNTRHLKILESPLLVWIACNLADEVKLDAAAWRRRTDLLELFIDEAIGKWMRRPPVPTVMQQSAFRTLLSDISLSLLRQRSQGDYWTRGVLLQQIRSVLKRYAALENRDILQDLINIGILSTLQLQSGEQALTFSHLAVGDYLAGVCIARRANTGSIKDIEELINSIAGEPSWQDAIVVAAVYMDNPIPLLDLLCNPKLDDETRRRLALAAHCLAEISSSM
jgi:hypothetical protein